MHFEFSISKDYHFLLRKKNLKKLPRSCSQDVFEEVELRTSKDHGRHKDKLPIFLSKEGLKELAAQV